MEFPPTRVVRPIAEALLGEGAYDRVFNLLPMEAAGAQQSRTATSGARIICVGIE